MKQPNMQTALITGASRGLGLSLAQILASRNWRLIIDARDQETLINAAEMLSNYTQVIALPGDVTKSSHRQELARAAGQAGGLDAVINNAGMLGPSPQPVLLDYPLGVLEDVFRTNVIAPLGLIQAMRDFLKPAARIINITSDAAVEPYREWGGYGSSKAALEQLSAVLAAENQEYRVYWVDPGDIRTQMHQDAFPGEDISDRPLPDEIAPRFIPLLEGLLPSGRYQAQEIELIEPEPQNQPGGLRDIPNLGVL